jgi:hypothetical protein
MKKILLLLISGSVALSSVGQERSMFLSGVPESGIYDFKAAKKVIKAETGGKVNPLKTTAAARWYSFADYFDTSEYDIGTGSALGSSYLWKDTSAVMAYSAAGGGTEWNHNRAVSLGLVTDPSFGGFNNSGYYLGEMQITPTNSYSVDSIRFFGIYGFKTTNTYVDTLRVAFVYGDASRGNGTSGPDVYLAKTGNTSVWANYGASDSMSTYRMHFDSTTTTANGTTRVTKDIILDNTTGTPAWGDTLSNGFYYGRVGLGDVSVPAGNLIGATITFISGSPSFTPDDTVFGSTMGYKHNMFRPFTIFRGASSAASFASYSDTNRNSGMFKTLPDTSLGWGGQYIPLWFWTSSGGASTYQYPYIDFHINCSACGVVTNGVNDVRKISKVAVYPNPAIDELNVPFTLQAAANTTISLQNIVGQVVATKNFMNVSSGKAVFDTRHISPGVYVCTVSSDGERYTARVTITH